MLSELPFSPRWLVLIAISFLLLYLSRHSLRNPRVHGFYRFFVFEGVVALMVINGAWGPSVSPPWLMVVGHLLVFLSVLFALLGYRLLRRRGGFLHRHNTPENFAFENTMHLVSDGIYRYIRHPMYSSLLLLAWAMFLRYPTLIGVAVLLPTTLFVIASAKVEERENILHFGDLYRSYMTRTKMFIPYLL